MPIQFTEARLRQALAPRPFRFFDQVGSTNDLARDWAQAGAPSGAVVVTEEQTAGRGRFDRRWSAPPASALLFSVITRPRLPAARLSRMTIVGALAVAECLEKLALPDVSIKWPNDVQIAGRKAAGILPEAVWQNDQLEAVVLGIGLNVRVDFSGTELAETAISIENVNGLTVDRAALLSHLLGRIDHWTARAGDGALLEAWRTRLTTLGQHVTATARDGQTIQGLAVGVDEDGALLVSVGDGQPERITSGEVTLGKILGST